MVFFSLEMIINILGELETMKQSDEGSDMFWVHTVQNADE